MIKKGRVVGKKEKLPAAFQKVNNRGCLRSTSLPQSCLGLGPGFLSCFRSAPDDKQVMETLVAAQMPAL